MAAKRVSYKVEGMVQGVNYRAFAVKQADGLNITGYAQNESDGTVSGEAQGDSSDIKEFLGHLNKGPSAAKVSGVEHNEISVKEGESGFQRK